MRMHTLQIQVSLAKLSNVKDDTPARKGLPQSRAIACVHSVDLWYPFFTNSSLSEMIKTTLMVTAITWLVGQYDHRY